MNNQLNGPLGGPLSGPQRRKLMKLAQSLDPVVMVGKAGATPEVTAACNTALEAHELIKLRFQSHKEQRRSIGEKMAAETGAVLVQVIGNTAVLFRRHPDAEKHRISLE